MALPKGMSADRFARMVLVTVSQNPRLAECTPLSILTATMIAAQLGLEPGPLGHCYLIPYKIKDVMMASFQFGYKGMIQLSYNSAELQIGRAHV